MQFISNILKTVFLILSYAINFDGNENEITAYHTEFYISEQNK